MYPEYQGIQITPEGKYNTLVDWAHEPLNGDPALYLEEIDNFFRDEPLMIDYWHDFVANIIQRPWIRNNTCPQFLSPIQGIGKSAIPEFIAEMMGNKYGQPATVIGPGELFESKNQELEGKLFVVVNEPNSDQNTHQAKFKDLITSPRLMIDRKYGAKFSIDNYINYVLTTNKPFVVQMDDGSRREAIYRPTSLTPEEMAPRIKRLMEWGRTQDGFGIVLNWYTQRDLSKFDPKAPAPMTDHKRAAVELSRTPLMAFAADLSRWVVEKLSGRAAFAPVHLIELCKLWGYGDKTQVSYIRRAMSNFGEVDGQKLIKVAGKPVKRTLFLTSKEANGGNLKNATTLSYADLAVQTDEYVTAEINGEAVEKF
jgi:hypothetical protein